MRRRTSYLPESTTAHLLDDASRRQGKPVSEEPFGAPLGKVFTSLGNPTPVDLASFMVDDFKPVTKDATKPDPVLPITSDGTYYICCTKGSELELDSATGHIYGIGVDTATNGDTTSIVSEDVAVHIDAQPDGADVLLKSGTVIYINKVGSAAVVPHTIKEAGCGMYEDKDNKNSDDVPLTTWNEAWRVAYNELPPDDGGAVLPNVIEIDNEEDGINTVELTGTGVDLIASCRKTTTTTDKRDLYGIPVLRNSSLVDPLAYTKKMLPNLLNYDRGRYIVENAVTTKKSYLGGSEYLRTAIREETKTVVVGTFEDEYTLSDGGGYPLTVTRNILCTYTCQYFSDTHPLVYGYIHLDYTDRPLPPPEALGFYGDEVYYFSPFDYTYIIGITLTFRLARRAKPVMDKQYWSNGYTCTDGSVDDTFIQGLTKGQVLSSAATRKVGIVPPTSPNTVSAWAYVSPLQNVDVLSPTNTPLGYVDTPTIRYSRHTNDCSSVIPTLPEEDLADAMPASTPYLIWQAFINTDYSPDEGSNSYLPSLASFIAADVISWDGTMYGVGSAILSIPELAGATVLPALPPSYYPTYGKSATAMPAASGSAQDPDSATTQLYKGVPVENEPLSSSGESLLSVERLYYDAINVDMYPKTNYYINNSVFISGVSVSRRVVAGIYTYPAETVEEKVTKNILRAKTSGVSIYPQQGHSGVAEPDIDLSGAGDIPHPDFVLSPAPTPPVDVQVTDDIL